MSINKILIELASTSSRLEKESILENYKNNELLKRVFCMALDPYVNYYIKIIPQYSNTGLFGQTSLDQALDDLSKLSSRIHTGHAGISHLTQILSSLSSDDADVVVKVIRRDLRCGVSVATVNKVWDNLIPVFPCMLCSPYDDKVIKKINFIAGAYCQQKEDGLRFNAIVENSACLFYSRKGSPIELADNTLADEFIRIANGENLVFDGELLAVRNGVSLPRKEGNGIANKAIKGTIGVEESKLLCGVLWDVIPLPDFKAGKSNVPYEDRYNKLVNLINTAYTEEIQVLNSIKHGFTKKIDVVKTHIVKSLDAAQEIFHQYLSKGLEGVIIKNKKSIWEDSRSKEQIKLKAEKVCELRVIGWNYGTVGTKNEFRLGSLLCASEDNKVVVNISGFSDDERDTITKENSVNKIVSVLYNERITKKAGGADSLFLPRIVEFREDKDFADKSEDIK